MTTNSKVHSEKTPIRYKDTKAMPGSELHKRLLVRDHKGAEKVYREAAEREAKLLGKTK